MDSAGKTLTGDSPLFLTRSDATPLVDSLRENIRQKIDETDGAAEREIERMEDELARQIDEYRNEQLKAFGEKVAGEGGRIRNLSVINLKKQRLDGMELFIKRAMDEAVSVVMGDPRYRDFLCSCVVSGLKNVNGSAATVLLAQTDLDYSQEIMEKIDAAGFKIRVRIMPDERIRLGGAMVIDDEAEVIYNSTVERIVYRKNDEIRREIMRNLKEHDAEHSPGMVSP